MATSPILHCPHTQWTGYDGHCVCISCGWTIHYDEIKLERNDASLTNYIKTVLKQLKGKNIETAIDFDVCVSPQGVVVEGGPNRIKFSIL
jgi:hypothetical protein